MYRPDLVEAHDEPEQCVQSRKCPVKWSKAAGYILGGGPCGSQYSKLTAPTHTLSGSGGPHVIWIVLFILMSKGCQLDSLSSQFPSHAVAGYSVGCAAISPPRLAPHFRGLLSSLSSRPLVTLCCELCSQFLHPPLW